MIKSFPTSFLQKYLYNVDYGYLVATGFRLNIPDRYTGGKTQPLSESLWIYLVCELVGTYVLTTY